MTLRATALLTAAFIGAASSLAAANTTYVSATGVNAGTCTLAAPCRNFNFAFSKTNANGTIIALNTASYGTVSINHAVTIEALPGTIASIQTAGGTTAISVNAPAADVVVLRNLDITGNGVANTTGIDHFAGKLLVEHSRLTGLTNAIKVTNAKMDLVDSTLAGNGTALRVSGSGTEAGGSTTVSVAQARLSNGNIIGNGTAFFMVSPGTGLVNILVRTYENSSFAFTTNITGNTIYTDGSGTGCPCTSVGSYLGAFQPK